MFLRSVFYGVWVTLLVLASASATAGTMTNPAGAVMEMRVSAGGGASYAGSMEMVNVIAGPIGLQATTPSGLVAQPFSPSSFALPVTVSSFTLD